MNQVVNIALPLISLFTSVGTLIKYLKSKGADQALRDREHQDLERRVSDLEEITDKQARSLEQIERLANTVDQLNEKIGLLVSIVTKSNDPDIRDKINDYLINH